MMQWLRQLSLSWPKRIKSSGTFFMIITFIMFYSISLLMSGVFLLLKQAYGWDNIQEEHPFAFFVVLMLITSVVGNVIAWIIGNPSIKNLASLSETANKIKNGQLEARAESARNSLLYNFTNNFNSMAEEIESVEAIKSDFVNAFSHEIKTPIVSIRGFAQELKNSDISEEDRQMYLDTIIRESDRLSKMATNVLNLSRVEQQGILTGAREYNLGEQVRQVVLLVMDKIDVKNIDLDIDIDDCKFVGNEALMEQVWINLIDNALKFTPDGGYIGISLHGDGREIKAVISDGGCGISEDELPYIFDKFYQATSSKKGSVGNGIGLTVVKKIVDLHSGRISCTSKEGEGTTFFVKLNKV